MSRLAGAGAGSGRTTRAMLLIFMVLGLVGCAHQGSPRSAITLPSFLSPVATDSRNAERTCAGKSIPNLGPTDTCAAWGKPVKAPWGIAVDVQADRFRVGKTRRAGVVQACTKVSYHNRSTQLVGVNVQDWVLVLPSRPPPASPNETYANPRSTLTPSGPSPITAGGGVHGTLCFDLRTPGHGRFLLRADSPVPTDAATSVFWEANL